MLKSLHIALALLSFSGLIIRAGWAFRFPELLRERWVRIAPHVVDTLLLALGVALLLRLPGEGIPTWLIVKMVSLLAYIGFGVLTLRASGNLRWVGLLGAIASFAAMYGIAITYGSTVP